jgi:hypothetical protein
VPAALRKALRMIFAGSANGLWLVGGTALAGYYAEHRRSDDLDLFADTGPALKAAILAVRGLKKQGAVLTDETVSPSYFHAAVRFSGHEFTVDIVLDENLHRFGRALMTDDGVSVASADTLFALKVAALLSRCGEKDLFDLDWLLAHSSELAVGDLLACGARIDAGVTAEGLLISLGGTTLRREACGFLLADSPLTVVQVFHRIRVLRQDLIDRILRHQSTQPLSAAAAAIRHSLKDFKR